MPYSGTFRQELKKNHCHIWNQHHWICKNAKFYVKKPKLSYLGSFGLAIYKAIVIFEISTAEFIKNKF